MASERAYLDYNASAPLLDVAREAMVAAMALPGNPSSVHREGRAVRRLIETARSDVAALVGAAPEHVVFTSGATEAASTLLSPEWRMGRAPLKMSRLYTSAADHPCLRSGGRFAAEDVELLPVGSDGLLDLDALRRALAAHDRRAGLPLVALHAANNETGVVQPMAAVASIVRDAQGVLVVDAVQAAGRLSIDIAEGWGDFLILSSHKIGGPRGVGAIVGTADLMMPVPLVSGGGQERGHRSGTENPAAIAGFGAAARAARAALDGVSDLLAMRARLEASIRSVFPDALIYGDTAPRLPNTVLFTVPGMKAETAQIAFDLAGVALSAGSACSSGKVGASRVLNAMGFGDEALGLRVSIGLATSGADLDRFEAALAGIAARSGAGKAHAA